MAKKRINRTKLVDDLNALFELEFKKQKNAAKISNTIRAPDKNQFVLFRNSKGRLVKNPRSNQKLIAEIRNRKTKKLEGYLNWVKNGIVEPKKFAKNYQRYLKTPRAKILPDVNDRTTFKYKINTSDLIVNQTIKNGKAAIDAVYKFSKLEGYCVFEMELDIMGDNPFIEAVNITKGTKWIDIAYIISSLVIDRMKDSDYRTSPKAVAYFPSRKHARQIKVFFKILDVHKMF